MPTARFITLLLLFAAPWLAGPLSAADPLEEANIRALVITGGHAYEKDAFEAMFEAMTDVSAKQASYPEAAELLQPELAERFDVLIFYDMWQQGITPEQQKSFVALLQRGIGVVALHHTLAAHQKWPEYEKIIGGKYHLQASTVDGQPLPQSSYFHDEDMKIEVVNSQHPITQGLEDFEIHDEAYLNYSTDPQATVLLATDHPKSDREIAWAKTYANSRVVYIELGHDHHAYEHPSYRTLVQRSIHYVAGRPADPEASMRKLFNGKDLTGWVAEGNADWSVQDGLLIGRQGPDNAPGDLFTAESFGDFELSVTYRVVWPANSGVWYRYQSGRQAFQVDILEYENPFALSGTLYRPGVPGQPFAAINTDESIFDRDGWNTIVVRAVGNRHIVLLNGTKTADVRSDLSLEGKIGFQVHAGDQFGAMQIVVRDIGIRPL